MSEDLEAEDGFLGMFFVSKHELKSVEVATLKLK